MKMRITVISMLLASFLGMGVQTSFTAVRPEAVAYKLPTHAVMVRSPESFAAWIEAAGAFLGGIGASLAGAAAWVGRGAVAASEVASEVSSSSSSSLIVQPIVPSASKAAMNAFGR